MRCDKEKDMVRLNFRKLQLILVLSVSKKNRKKTITFQNYEKVNQNSVKLNTLHKNN